MRAPVWVGRGGDLHALSAAVLTILIAAGSAGAEMPFEWVARPAPGPSPRAEYGFAYDAAESAAVLFGGSSTLSFSAVNSETWTWDGDAWTLADTAGMTRRCDNAMAYDASRSRIVSFGGYDGSYLGDNWLRDAQGWRSLGVSGPAARADAFMAFDSARGVMVLFGGQASNGAIRRDTWEFEDSTWTQRASGGPPPARWIHRMAYDSGRGVTVMFGGASPTGLLSDTWEWNGTTWLEVAIPGPPARYGNALAYDPVNQVTVLFGGQSGFDFGENPLGDTWIYDGASWTELPISGPGARTFVKMVYDPARRRMVLFGGHDGDAMQGDTWELVLGEATGVPGERGGEGSGPRGPSRPDASGDRGAGWVLHGNAPNPFSESTVIAFDMPSGARASVSIFDAGGRLVRRLESPAGTLERAGVRWDGRDQTGRKLPAGVYAYELRDGGRGREPTRLLGKLSLVR